MKVFKWFAFLVVGALIALMAWVLIQHWQSYDEHIPVSKLQESMQEGQFVSLDLGTTYVQTYGSPLHSPIVLIHGFNHTQASWGAWGAWLAQQGYYVIQYDLFGHGYSERVNHPYELILFEQQLEQLLTALNIKQAVSFIGHDLGAAIAAQYAQKYKQATRALVYVNPHYQAKAPLTIPTDLAYYFLSAFYQPSLDRFMIQQTEKYELPSRFYPAYHEHTQILYTLRSITSMIAYLMPMDVKPIYQGVDQQLPIFIVGAKDDALQPYAVLQQMLVDLNLPASSIAIEEQGGHWVHLSRSQQTQDAVLSFLNRIYRDR